jgi:hypothetical protein
VNSYNVDSLTVATVLLQAANDAKEAALQLAETNEAEARRQEKEALEQKQQAQQQGDGRQRHQDHGSSVAASCTTAPSLLFGATVTVS